MKYHFIVLSCLLLVWTLTVFVSCDDTDKTKITVATVSDGIKVKCPDGYTVRNSGAEEDKGEQGKQEIQLDYRDENSEEYECFKQNAETQHKILVKFRTCDNCIELDIAAIMGIVIGDLVATIGVGFGVYLIAAHGRSGPPAPSRNKASDRQHLVPREMGASSSEHYQQLRHKGRKDEYDVINKRR